MYNPFVEIISLFPHNFVLFVYYNRTDVPPRKVSFMKEQYILQINEHLQKCDDLSLLDLILQLLDKSI